MNIIKRNNKKGDKITFYYDYGRCPGQRPSTGVFVYANPKNQVEKNHNKQALLLLETKKSQLIIQQQAVGSAYIPAHKFKSNFIEYFEEYVDLNKRKGNRHLSNSLTQFKLFIKQEFISPTDITENFCKRFRQFLLDKYSGETPGGYYARFKWVINAAESDGYFQKNPTANVFAKSNPSSRLKENLEIDEYLKLLKTPCLNEEIKSAFIFCCYTGLRWVDIKKLEYGDIRGNVLTTRIVQAKTGFPVTLTMRETDIFSLKHISIHKFSAPLRMCLPWLRRPVCNTGRSSGVACLRSMAISVEDVPANNSSVLCSATVQHEQVRIAARHKKKV